MNLLKKILQLNKYQLGVQFFAPVLIAFLLYTLTMKLTGFIVFQFFIEIFVLWHFSIGLTLSRNDESPRQRNIFIFNMLFALLYRMSSNAYQIWYRTSFGVFPELESMLWLTPIHFYASLGSIYCFYQNSKWIIESEKRLRLHDLDGLRKTFWQILVFPVGIWLVQPRLNRISASMRLA